MVDEENIELEITEEYQQFLDALFQKYSITGDTMQEKISQVVELTGMPPSSIFAAEQARQERTDSAYTPLGLPREQVKYAGTPQEQVVNTYDYLVANTNFVPYIKGDSSNILDSLTTDASVQQLQTRLLDAGYLTSGSYIPGFIGKSTTQALDNLLGDANNAGENYDYYLEQILLNPKYDASLYPTEPELDYNVLGNTVISTLKKELGREPTESEYQILLGILAGYETEEYKQTLESMGPQYKEVRKTIALSSTGGPTVTVPTGEIERVQPTTPDNAKAMFESKVRELFKPEMDLNQRREQTQNVSNIIKSSIAGLRSIGG
jgi:hypothetical protein